MLKAIYKTICDFANYGYGENSIESRSWSAETLAAAIMSTLEKPAAIDYNKIAFAMNVYNYHNFEDISERYTAEIVKKELSSSIGTSAWDAGGVGICCTEDNNNNLMQVSLFEMSGRVIMGLWASDETGEYSFKIMDDITEQLDDLGEWDWDSIYSEALAYI